MLGRNPGTFRRTIKRQAWTQRIAPGPDGPQLEIYIPDAPPEIQQAARELESAGRAGRVGQDDRASNESAVGTEVNAQGTDSGLAGTAEPAETGELSTHHIYRGASSEESVVRSSSLPPVSAGTAVGQTPPPPGGPVGGASSGQPDDAPKAGSVPETMVGVDMAYLANVDERRRQVALDRWTVLDAWERYQNRVGGGSPWGMVDRFLASWNAEHPNSRPVTRRTLQKWAQDYRANRIMGLVPKARNKRANTVPADLWGRFCTHAYQLNDGTWVGYLDLSQPNASECLKHVKEWCDQHGRKCPSYNTFQKAIKSISEATYIAYRKGKKAFTDLCEPYMERDYTTLDANEWWCSDHHVLDLLCRFPDGSIGRPWLTAWQDVRSRKIVGWTVCESPNTDTIMASLRQAVMVWGIPLHVLIDNGKDYRNQHFANMRNQPNRKIVDEGRVRPLLAQLDVVAHFCKIYHGQSKPVERFFEEVKNRFAKYFISYKGGRPDEKPEERLKQVEKSGNYPSIEDVRERFETWVEKHHNALEGHRGNGMDRRSPNQVYGLSMSQAAKRTAPEAALNLLLMRTTKPLKIQQNGVRIWDDWYRADEMFDRPQDLTHLYLRYDPDNLDQVLCFTPDDRLFCTAYSVGRFGWGATAADVRDAHREKSRIRRYTKGCMEALQAAVEEPDLVKQNINKTRPQSTPETGGPARLEMIPLDDGILEAANELSGKPRTGPDRLHEDDAALVVNFSGAGDRVLDEQSRRELEQIEADRLLEEAQSA